MDFPGRTLEQEDYSDALGECGLEVFVAVGDAIYGDGEEAGECYAVMGFSGPYTEEPGEPEYTCDKLEGVDLQSCAEVSLSLECVQYSLKDWSY